MTPHPFHLRTALCLTNLALGLTVSASASAQTYKQRQQGIGLAAMAIEAYEKSASQCHYDPAVGGALAEVERFFEQTQPYAWQKAKREAPYGLNMGANISQAITGRAGDLDCKAYGTLVSNGLFYTMAAGKIDPVVMAEMERLANDGGRRRAGAAPSSPNPQAGSSVKVPVYETGSFPISDKDVGATIKELKGIDTQNSYMAGTVTQGDAEEYCTRDPGGMTVANGGKLSLDQCIVKILSEKQRAVYQVKANCQLGRVEDVHGRTLTLGEIQTEGGHRTANWRDLMGTTFDALSDPRIPIMEAQFAKLCPARWGESQGATAASTGSRRDFEGVWAETEAECQDEEGPNTRTVIDLRNKKVGALFEGYEKVCRIGTIEGQNPVRLLMTCYEFWENLEAEKEPYHETVVIASQGQQSISLNGKPYVRCLR